MKKFKIVIAGLSVFLLISSCSKDYLDKAPPDALTQDGFFNSAERAGMGVNAVYTSLQGAWATQLLRIFDVPSGEVVLSNTTPLEYNNFTYHPALTQIHEAWSGPYEGITRANSVIKNLPSITMDETLKNRYIGEAKFLRAFNYFTLTNLFGGVPLVTEPLPTTDAAFIAKSSLDDVNKVIIKDLQDAIAVLPVSYGAADVGRATKGAAQALLGKVYLYVKDYTNAAAMFQLVMDSGKYGLMDNFEQVWNVSFENNKESVFEIQFADIGGSGTNGRNGSFLPAVNGATGSALASKRAVDAFASSDPRLDFSIFLPGRPFAPNVSTALATFNPTWSATGYAVKKGMVPIAYVNGSGTNYPIIRYADVLLMYAEAANELNLIDKARDAVNKVRQRLSVNMPALTTANTGTKATLFDAIVKERQVELMFEFHRFNDLRRWGLAEKELGNIGYTAKYRYFPIPQLELDINPKLVQNTGW